MNMYIALVLIFFCAAEEKTHRDVDTTLISLRSRGKEMFRGAAV